jgi:hypothetical protein
MRRIWIVRSIFAGCVLALMVGAWISIYWLNEDGQPYTNARPAELIDMQGLPRTAYKAGETIVLVRHYCLTKRIEGAVVRRWLQDESVVGLPPGQVINELPVGCATNHFAVVLPPDLHPGPWAYHAEYDIPLNPLKRVRYQLPPLPFTVTSNALVEQFRAIEKRHDYLERLDHALDRKVRDLELAVKILTLRYESLRNNR